MWTLKKILNYILGYIHIIIEGFFVERVINQAIKRKIFFWNVKKENGAIVYANVGINNFRELVKLAKNNKCKIKILNKSGLPFVFNKYRKRKIFLIFIFIILISLIALSKFVWNIDLQGVNKIDKNELLLQLESEGLKVGSLKAKVNTDEIINKIRLERSDISWIGIDVSGTNAVIKVVEAESKPELIDEEDYCNIVATDNAQIIKISAQNGIPVVSEGDIVTKGQILIAGWVDGKYTGTRYVHASGEIKAKVWHSKKEKISLTQTITEQTGNFENKYEVKFNNFTINLYKTLSKFEKYDTIETYSKVKIFSDFYLPIEIKKSSNFETQSREITYGSEDAISIGTDKLSKEIEEQIDTKNVLRKYVNTYAGDGYIEVEVTYEVLENIGTKEKIVF